ncbi:MAG: hypothetical protein U0531_15985 [Dehalococcoidia bacterium]
MVPDASQQECGAMLFPTVATVVNRGPSPSSVPTSALVCPACGRVIPIDRPVLAARLRCPDARCGARLQMRAGLVRAA